MQQWWNDADGKITSIPTETYPNATWPPNIPTELACHWTQASAVKGRKSGTWTMAGTDQTRVFWDVTSPWYPEHPTRHESSSAPLWETEISQILHSFLSTSDTSLGAFCLSPFCLLFSSFLSSHLPPPTISAIFVPTKALSLSSLQSAN